MSDIKKTDLYWIIKPIWDSKGYVQGYEEFRSIPSADVAPVRHGMWVDVDRMQMHDLHGVLTWGNSFMCTECNFKTFAVEGHMSQYRYCPNCGARMDGESDE